MKNNTNLRKRIILIVVVFSFITLLFTVAMTWASNATGPASSTKISVNTEKKGAVKNSAEESASETAAVTGESANSAGVANNVEPDIIVVIIGIAITVGITMLILFILRRLFQKYSFKENNDISKERKTMMRVVNSILRFIILLIAAITILSILGVDVTGAVTALGIAGACGALAVQDLLKDLIQGVNIVGGKYYSIGDVLQIDGDYYRVIELTMRNTKLIRLPEQDFVMTVGNRTIDKAKKVQPGNFYVDINYPMSYQDDLGTADEVINACVSRLSSMEKTEKCLYKGTTNFNDSSIYYLIRIFCKPENGPEMRRQSLRIFQEEMAKKGLSIPFPQVDVHFDKP